MNSSKILCRLAVPTLLLILFLPILPFQEAYGWSNGGYSECPCNPAMGTHDWIVSKAVELLPASESEVFRNNINWLRYGTEWPDRSQSQGGYDDSYNHHVYFDETKRVLDDAAATRANETYQEAQDLLRRGNFSGGVTIAGAMSHYITDAAVWAHLMGEQTGWGIEKHHEDYENYVSEHQVIFEQSISLLRPLERISAYQATLDLASNVMFETPNATWMDNHYDWNDSQFKSRVGTTLNLAANYVAEVLHTLWLDSGQPLPEFPLGFLPVIVLVATATLNIIRHKSSKAPHAR